MQWANKDEPGLIVSLVQCMVQVRQSGMSKFKKDWLKTFFVRFVEKNQELRIHQYLRFEEIVRELGVSLPEMCMDSRVRIPSEKEPAKRRAWYARRAARRLKAFTEACEQYGVSPDWIRSVLTGQGECVIHEDRVYRKIRDKVIDEVNEANKEIIQEKDDRIAELEAQLEALRKRQEVAPPPKVYSTSTGIPLRSVDPEIKAVLLNIKSQRAKKNCPVSAQ